MMKAKLDRIGAWVAVLFYVTAILVFVVRLLGVPQVGRWVGPVEFLLAVPLVYLLVKAQQVGRPVLYYIQIGCVLAWLLVEALLDYILVLDFRGNLSIVIPYVILFFAAAGGLLGIAANAGRKWTYVALVLFFITAVLAFVQRAMTGM
jgi:hypothetical protein